MDGADMTVQDDLRFGRQVAFQRGMIYELLVSELINTYEIKSYKYIYDLYWTLFNHLTIQVSYYITKEQETHPVILIRCFLEIVIECLRSLKIVWHMYICRVTSIFDHYIGIF